MVFSPKQIDTAPGMFESFQRNCTFGQLHTYLRGEYLVDLESLTKIQGKPFMTSEIVNHIQQLSGR